MSIITDYFTLQGASLLHLEHGCQDYAHGFSDGDLRIALVSDGCSSAPNSDVGARLLVLTAGRILKDWLPQRLTAEPTASASSLELEFRARLISQLAGLYAMLNEGAFLGPLFMDCTLVLAAQYKDRAFAFMYGDGYVGADYLDNTTEVFRSEYTITLERVERSGPFYLSYQLPQNENRLRNYGACNPIREDTLHVLRPAFGDNWEVSREELHTFGRPPVVLDFDFNRLRSLVVSSDGIGSFGDNVKFHQDIAADLLKFPVGSRGNILRRKMLFNSTRIWPKKGWKHQDDLGLAAIIKQ